MATTTFGERLRESRERAGLSRERLALKTGLSGSIVEKLELGQRSQPKTSTLVALSRVLGVSLTWLATGEVAA